MPRSVPPARQVLLRREVEDARSNKDEREFQIGMAAQKNARANASLDKLFQLSSLVVAKIGASSEGGGGGAATGGGASPFTMLVSEFWNSLRPEQIRVLVTRNQKMMFKEIIDMAMAAQQANAPKPPNGTGGSASP